MLDTKSSKPNLTRIGEFTRSNPPEVVAFYKREAETDVRLPWRPRNITRTMQLERVNPTLRQLAARAEQIEQAWIQDELDELRSTERSIANRREVEKLLR